MSVPGSIRPPFVDIFQIYRLSEPTLPEVTLPAAIIGLVRQIEIEQDAGALTIGTATTFSIPGITKYSATIVEMDPITGETLALDDEGDHVSVASPSLPKIEFVHAQFGRFTIPSGVNGWTLNAGAGEFDISATFEPIYTITSGTTASFTAEGTPTLGKRTFTDLNNDFLTAGVTAGDEIILPSGDTFIVDSIVNDFTLVVVDGSGSLASTATATNQSYTIEKTLTSGSGTVIISYAADRSDLSNKVLTFTSRTDVLDRLGPPVPHNPGAMAVDLALRNGQTAVKFVMLEADTLAGHLTAMDVLSNDKTVYGIVPLTQDEAILTEYKNHVIALSDPEKGGERVLWRVAKLDIQTTRDSAESFHSVTVSGANNETVLFEVTAGNDNIHTKGVIPGDILTDLETGGSGRVIAVVPAGPADDDDVTLTIATPNTIPDNATFATATLVSGAGGLYDDGDTLLLEDGAGVEVTFEFDRTGLNTPGGLNSEIDISGTASTASFTSDVQATYADGDTLTITDTFGTTVVFEFDVTGTNTPGAGNVEIDISALVTAIAVADAIRTAIGASALQITTDAPGAALVNLTQDGAGADGTNATPAYAGSGAGILGITTFTGGTDLTAIAIADLIRAAITGSSLQMTPDAPGSATVVITQDIGGIAGNTLTPVYSPSAGGTGIGGIVLFAGGTGSNWNDWVIQSYPLDEDAQAAAIAQHTDNLDCLRVRNIWPDETDMLFSDVSAGVGAEPGVGLFGQQEVIWLDAGGFWLGVVEAAKRSRFRPGLPLTGRPGAGIYRIKHLTDRYNLEQIELIISTGTYVIEQPNGDGGSVQAIIATTTDDSDLSTSFEMGISQVDLYSKLVRNTLKPLFGRNALDSNFLAILGTKLQAVNNKMLRAAERNAESIVTRSIRRDPDRRDRVIMEVDFQQLQAANGGIINIFVS